MMARHDSLFTTHGDDLPGLASAAVSVSSHLHAVAKRPRHKPNVTHELRECAKKLQAIARRLERLAEKCEQRQQQGGAGA
jgi:hypothetical protein